MEILEKNDSTLKVCLSFDEFDFIRQVGGAVFVNRPPQAVFELTQENLDVEEKFTKAWFDIGEKAGLEW